MLNATTAPMCRAPRTHTPRSIPDLDRLPGTALLTSQQVADALGYSAITLKVWRKSQRGPSFTLLEGRPRYRVADLQAYLKEQGGAVAA